MLMPQLAAFFYNKFWIALDWIYPPVCAGCGEPGYRLCQRCQSLIRWIEGGICIICGKPVTGSPMCTDCKRQLPPYDSLRSLAEYKTVIRECVHALKYKNNQSLGEFFSSRMIQKIEELNWEIDVVIPVPLSPNRLAIRGYNQSALLARPIAYNCGFRYQPFGLKRIRNTRSQVELPAQERRSNVAGAFMAFPEIVKEKNILLVDDVTTTGSTIEECALALKTAGASKVFCLTLARPLIPENITYPNPASSIIC